MEPAHTKQSSIVLPKLVSFKSQGGMFTIINEANGSIFPVLALHLDSALVEMISKHNGLEISTEIKTTGDCYNLFAGVWEPIFEEYTFKIKYVYDEFKEPQT